jgi:D-glycero-D-manno-heptose 1,7-bisphosphate phosphatase
MKKAVFLDKDGTLIPDIPYNVDPDKITLQEGAVEGLKKLSDAGYLLIVISNQAGVAKGYFAEHDLPAVQERLGDMLASENIKLSGFYYCPHHPQGKVERYTMACDCRKPAPGMIIRAAKDFSVDLSSSWMIGDILNDVEAGNAAGCKTILIDNGNETEWVWNKNREPVFRAKDILQAAEFILNER